MSTGQNEVRVARGKGDKERIVPMGPRLRRSLRRYLMARNALVPPTRGPSPTFPHGERNTYNRGHPAKVAALLGEGSTPEEGGREAPRPQAHVWHLLSAREPDQLIELADLMGHSNLSRGMKYALSDAERARMGVAKL